MENNTYHEVDLSPKKLNVEVTTEMVDNLTNFKLDDLNKIINDPEWKADVEKWFEKFDISETIQKQRFNRLAKYLKTVDFDKLIYRLIDEHNDEYIDKCYNNGYQPYPNNKLNFLLNYLCEKYKERNVKELDSDFMNTIRQYKGYYFQIIYGQGSIMRIYNKRDFRLLLQV
jgi:hypothetical protein